MKKILSVVISLVMIIMQAQNVYAHNQTIKNNSKPRINKITMLTDYGITLSGINPKKAIKYLNEALFLNPKSAMAYFGKGESYRYLLQYHEAINNYKKAIKLKHNFAAAYNGLGITYIMSGKKTQGCLDMRKACLLNHLCGTFKYFEEINICRII